ncbi:hypothetical protein AOQ84DRAFT_355945 [Glonium stellatum]|uniref:F-box domain-containing protein n=1 Tax=Glonium stellatum TaxID=574774 RepID=A0A8E2EVB2_9PEZI|nr:hypothetical protein AOQ84DRAFT_355945 [Glonium stellatum]
MKSETGAGAPSVLLRFAIFVPLAIYWADATAHWDLISHHAVLQQPPFSPDIARGEKIAAKWVSIIFYWNFALWIPNCMFPNALVFMVGLVDSVFTVMMAIAAHLQTGYSPHSYSDCRHGTAETWQVPQGTPSFFHVAGQLNATKASAEKMCLDYVEEWKYGIAMVVLYSFIAGCNIILSAALMASAFYDGSYRQHRTVRQWCIDTATGTLKIITTIFCCFALLPVCLFNCLPMCIKSRARFIARCVAKTSRRMPSPREIKLQRMRPKNPKPHYEGRYEGKGTAFTDFLCYDVLVLISRDLHYVDLVNLSLASKSVREVVFPRADFATRSEHFKMYSCDELTKTQCWVCTVQVCTSCQITRPIRETHTLYHLNHCKLYCSSCYFQHVCRLSTTAQSSMKCHCSPTALGPWAAIWRTPRRRITLQHHYPPVCRLCNMRDDATLTALREARSRAEMRDLTRQPDCARCELVLPVKGPRWWVCTRCSKECGSHMHPPWGLKSAG